MPMPMRRSRPRAVRPVSEMLETRVLLSKTVSGTDIDGDTWTLTLTGPGDLRVVKQNDASGNPTALTAHSQIDTIEVAGADPTATRLDGHVTAGPGGDGKVYFKRLKEIGGRSESVAANNGIQTIDMPQFWLADTDSTPAAPTQTNPAPGIDIPDGVNVLRFGGADATLNPPGPAQAGGAPTANNLTVRLGLPYGLGTSIIVNKVISGSRPGVSQGGQPAQPVQDSVIFTTAGRLNLFQADEIVGNTASPSSGFQGGGGTFVASIPDTTSSTTGQIGNVRVGGNATNFSVQTNDKVSNFYVGGETNSVFLLAPGGSRNVYFGKGMDSVTIDSHTLENLTANRGALNSTVQVDRAIGRVQFGGDVVDTKVLSGYTLGLSNAFQNQSAPTPTAQIGGGMTVLVAGNVKDSVFAASAEPFREKFGTANDLFLPTGHIDAKVEGTIDNATATPDQPTKAFYASAVHLTHGPVIPPAVPEAPFPTTNYHRGQRPLVGPLEFLRHGPPANKVTPRTHEGTAGGTRTTTGGTIRTPAVHQAALPIKAATATPRGPMATKSSKPGGA